MPLAPGRWYLGVFNADPTNVTYTILATEYTNAFPNIITLTNGVPYPNANSGAGDATDYYHYVVTTNAVRAQFEIDGPTGGHDPGGAQRSAAAHPDELRLPQREPWAE